MMFDRRRFLQISGAAVAAWRLPDVARAQSTAADNRRGVTPGTDTKDIRVGVIGVRSRGVNHLRGMATNVAAICDVDRKILAVRGNEVQKHLGRTVKQFDDYRQLLQDPAIDAVSIATPNHWHTLMAIEALQAGKHVYVEKPVSHTVWEGRQLVAAAQKYGRIVQCGTQLRSSVAVQKGVELARSGELGLIQYAYATCYKPRKSIGLLKYPLQIPNHVNYELWCGPAQRKDIYRPSLHYDWHWDFNTGNGEVGNQGVHQLDIARWFLGHTDLPRRVISVGGRVGYLDAGETPNTLLTWFDYPQAPIYFECRGLPKSKVAWQEWETSMDTYRSSQVGVIVQCEKGYFHVPFSGEEVDVHDNQDQLVTKLKEPLPNHYHNWLQAIAANDTASVKGPILEGHVSTSLCHLANVSYRLGEHMAGAEIRDRLQAEQGSERMIEALERVQHHLQDNHIDVEKTHPLFLGPLLNVDPAQERFVDNDLADELLRREYRAPFEVPDLTASI